MQRHMIKGLISDRESLSLYMNTNTIGYTIMIGPLII